MKKLARNIVCAVLAACLVVAGLGYAPRSLSAEAEAATSAPAYNAKLTQKNMLRLMRTYDRDAYRILSDRNKAGDSFSEWMKGSKRLVDAADTTTHEEFHSYIHGKGGVMWRGGSATYYDLYYLGNGKTRKVPLTKLFKTSKATAKIPKRYRTVRYDLYASKSSELSSNERGVYGLLDEFSAYYWGMHAAESLYPYLKKHVGSASGYSTFVYNFLNDRDAYAEFYYWTLVYLDYARTKKPAVYKQILANEAYVKTLETMCSKYQKLMKAYEKDLDAVCKKYNGGAGFSKSYDAESGALRLGNTALWSGGAYATLHAQLGSAKYQKVRKALEKAA